MAKKTKLELTWIGKEDRPRLEPRVLVEDPRKSYHAAERVSDNDLFDNRLIYGDNLLALKALEQEFSGGIQCVYIDPPYNTGSAFHEYEDGLEHSIWLGMMRARLEILHRLLAASGSLWVQLDDNEAHYCKVMLDEIFGRTNFVGNVIWQKSYAVRSNASFMSSSHEHILVYAKDFAKLHMNKFQRSSEQRSRFRNPDDDPRGPWQSVAFTISLVGGARGRQYARTGESENIFEVTSPSGAVFLPPPNRCWARNPEGYRQLNEDGRLYWGPNGDRAPRIKMFLSESRDEVMPTTLWADGDQYGFNQDGVREIRDLRIGATFPTPKPEKLISNILQLATKEGDIVLDSFLGSGTTAAVAAKMNRRWIGVELGEHCESICLPRLRKVIDGEDPGGITKAADWQGGGGFRYYSLAPSLLQKDDFGHWVINREYDAAKLAQAVCKIEAFTYAPSDEHYWQHGHSTESDYIYVTTQTLTRAQIEALADEVGPNRSLVIYCRAFRVRNTDQFPNLTLKKIPKAVLTKCEWGHDDYSLEIRNLPSASPSANDDSGGPPPPKTRRTRKAAAGQPTLFSMEGGEQ